MPCNLCQGTGFQPVYELGTWRDGKMRRQTITREQYEYLAPRIDRTKQEVYESMRRCECRLAPAAKEKHA